MPITTAHFQFTTAQISINCTLKYALVYTLSSYIHLCNIQMPCRKRVYLDLESSVDGSKDVGRSDSVSRSRGVGKSGNRQWIQNQSVVLPQDLSSVRADVSITQAFAQGVLVCSRARICCVCRRRSPFIAAGRPIVVGGRTSLPSEGCFS